MGRFKLIGLLAVPMLVSVAPSPWILLPVQARPARQMGQVVDSRLDECSGLAISRTTGNALWTHNDSGDAPRLFLIATDGRTLMRLNVRGADAEDWEDVCSFRADDRNWILIGDVGDNARNRSEKEPAACLYLVEEPEHRSKVQTATPTRCIPFRYEDGPHDCEAVAVDPVNRTVLLLTKSLDPRACKLYQLPLSLEAEPAPSRRNRPRLVAKAIAKIPLPIVTGMDLSADGRILLVTTPTVAFAIRRRPGDTWQQAASRAPIAIQLPRMRQCEAICFGRTTDVAWAVSEGARQPIWQLDLSATRDSTGK